MGLGSHAGAKLIVMETRDTKSVRLSARPGSFGERIVRAAHGSAVEWIADQIRRPKALKLETETHSAPLDDTDRLKRLMRLVDQSYVEHMTSPSSATLSRVLAATKDAGAAGALATTTKRMLEDTARMQMAVPTSFLEGQAAHIDAASEAAIEDELLVAARHLEEAYYAFVENPSPSTGLAIMAALSVAAASRALPIEELEMISATVHHLHDEPWITPEALKPLVSVADLVREGRPEVTLEEQLFPPWLEALKMGDPVKEPEDFGIFATPPSRTPRREEFGGIFCVVCDRDQLDFIGTGRQESWMELALTYDAAFHKMVWMSGFSEGVLEDRGVDFSDPNLDTLVEVLDSITNDTWSYLPYETAIERRLLNFLQ